MLVKSLMSENMIVAQRRSTYSLVARLSPWTMRCTTVSGTNRANRAMPLLRRSNVSCSCAISCMLERLPRQKLENSSESVERSRLLNFSMSMLRLLSSPSFRDTKMPAAPTTAVPTPRMTRSVTTILVRTARRRLCSSSRSSWTPCSIAAREPGSSLPRSKLAALLLNAFSASSASMQSCCPKNKNTAPRHAAATSAKKPAATAAPGRLRIRIQPRDPLSDSCCCCCCLTMVAGVKLMLLTAVDME
mmetsp:Transcript_98141/g.277792  ORF Transcript_98141/g.277792 Transcript_98141/m.277792 type:complete len:246 (+) Transcript_98141:1736-2473(+)